MTTPQSRGLKVHRHRQLAQSNRGCGEHPASRGLKVESAICLRGRGIWVVMTTSQSRELKVPRVGYLDFACFLGCNDHPAK